MGGRDEQALTLDSALVRNDERAYLTHRLLTLSAADTSTFIYPRLFAVHTLSGAVGCQGPHGQVVLPPTLSLTADKLDGSGAFLLDNGETLMLWLGAEVARSFLTQVFNVGALGSREAETVELVPQDNELSRRLCAIVDSIRARRPSYQVLQVVVQRDAAAEASLLPLLVEDRHATVVSYIDFLCTIHSQIQQKLA